MSQEQVYDVLKESKTGMTPYEIMLVLEEQGVHISKGTIVVNLSRLTNQNDALVVRYYTGNLNRPRYILKKYVKKSLNHAIY